MRFADFDNPIRPAFYAREEINMQRNVASKLFQYLKKTVIKDETNYVQPKHEDQIAEDTDREEFSTLERDGSSYCFESTIQAGGCQPYLTIEYRSSGLQDTCVRSYTNIIDAVSNIGGFKELVFMGVVVVYTFYNDFFMNRYLVSEFVLPNSLLFSSDKAASNSNNRRFQDHKPYGSSSHPHSSKIPFGREPSSFSPDAQDISSTQQIRHAEDSRSETEKSILDKFKGSMKEDIMSVIEEVTSIPTMIRELATLRVLKEIFFEKHHLKLLPLVQIEMGRKRKQQKEKTHSKSTSEIMPNLLSFISDALDFRTAIALLRPKKSSRGADGDWAFASNQPHEENPFRQAIDRFFLENLPAFLQQDAGVSPDEHQKENIEIPPKGLNQPRAELRAHQEQDQRHTVSSKNQTDIPNMDFFSQLAP